MDNELGKLIRRARQAKGWTQRELAKAMGVSAGYIGQIETGKVGLPREEQIDNLERLLGTSRTDILRAAGILDVPRDVEAELRRINEIADLKERVRALKALPPHILGPMRSLAVDLVHQASLPDSEAD
jgi:transcriptional regulator with XRE-family HTH domain